jgi:hypothetical protein
VLEKLSNNRGDDPDTARESSVTTYKVRLEKDTFLSVTLPGSLRPDDAIVVIDQLRELADGLASAAGTTDFDLAAREELLRLSEDLEHAAAPRLDEAQRAHLLEAYDLFRQAVVAYLRGPE